MSEDKKNNDELKKEKNIKEKKKKEKKKNIDDIEIDLTDAESEELKELLKELSEENPELKEIIDNAQNNNVKGIRIINMNKKSPKNKILEIIRDILINLVVVFSLSGLLSWNNGSIKDIIVFSLIYSLISTILNYIIITFFPKIPIFVTAILKTLTYVGSYIIASVLVPIAKSQYYAILFFLLFVIVRGIIRIVILQIEMKIKFKRGKK